MRIFNEFYLFVLLTLFVLTKQDKITAYDYEVTFYGCPHECHTQEKPSCQEDLDPSGYFCALSTRFNTRDYCFDYAVVMLTNGQKKMVKAKIVDECGSCERLHVDLSNTAFKEILPESTGVGNIIWGIYSRDGRRLDGPFTNNAKKAGSYFGISSDSFIKAFDANAKSLAASSSYTRQFDSSIGKDNKIDIKKPLVPTTKTTTRRVTSSKFISTRKTTTKSITTTSRRTTTKTLRTTSKILSPAAKTIRTTAKTLPNIKTINTNTAPSYNTGYTKIIPASDAVPVNKAPINNVPINNVPVNNVPLNNNNNIVPPSFPSSNTGYNIVPPALPNSDDGYNIVPPSFPSSNSGFDIVPPSLPSSNSGYNIPDDEPTDDDHNQTKDNKDNDDNKGSGPSVGVLTAIGGGSVLGAASIGLLFLKKKNPRAFTEVKRSLSRGASTLKRRVTNRRQYNNI